MAAAVRTTADTMVADIVRLCYVPSVASVVLSCAVSFHSDAILNAALSLDVLYR